MGNYTVRDMNEQDCAEVNRVVCASFRRAAERDGITYDEIGRYVSERGSEVAIHEQFQEQHFLIACAGQSVVGVVGVKGNEVTKVYVDPRLHRQGIGTLLFRAAEQVIRRAGHKEMMAGVAFDAAIPFYEAMGMSAVGRNPDILGPAEGGNPLLMKKLLLAHEGPNQGTVHDQ